MSSACRLFLKNKKSTGLYTVNFSLKSLETTLAFWLSNEMWVFLKCAQRTPVFFICVCAIYVWVGVVLCWAEWEYMLTCSSVNRKWLFPHRVWRLGQSSERMMEQICTDTDLDSYSVCMLHILNPSSNKNVIETHEKKKRDEKERGVFFINEESYSTKPTHKSTPRQMCSLDQALHPSRMLHRKYRL